MTTRSTDVKKDFGDEKQRKVEQRQRVTLGNRTRTVSPDGLCLYCHSAGNLDVSTPVGSVGSFLLEVLEACSVVTGVMRITVWR